MPQAKKRKSTKTAKKATTRKSGSRSVRRTTKTARENTTEKWHVYIMTALSMILAILLCTEAAIFAVL